MSNLWVGRRYGRDKRAADCGTAQLYILAPHNKFVSRGKLHKHLRGGGEFAMIDGTCSVELYGVLVEMQKRCSKVYDTRSLSRAIRAGGFINYIQELEAKCLK